MASSVLRLRSELRSNWLALAFVGVLLCLAGGTALTAAAGAVRTYTVGDRLMTATHTSELLALPESDGANAGLTADMIKALPQVADVIQQAGAFCFIEGSSDLFGGVACRFTANESGLGISQVARTGRLYNPDRADEIYINEAAAKVRGWHVGQKIRLRFVPELNASNIDTFSDTFIEDVAAGKVGTARELTVVGTGIGMYSARHDYPTVFLTDALRDELHLGALYWGFGVHLKHNQTDTGAVQEAISALVPGEQMNYAQAVVTRDTIRNRLTPEAVALGIFALVIAGTGLGLWAQAALRQTRLATDEDRVMTALGAPRSDRLQIAVARTLIVCGPAVAGSVVAAWLASGLLPAGAGRQLEPNPGRLFDGGVLLPAAALWFALALAISIAVHLRSSGTGSRVQKGSEIARKARQLAGPPTAAIGIGHALESRGDAESVPARSTLIGAVVGVTLAVTVVTFTAGLSHFVNTPSTYGWPNDVIIDVSDGYHERVQTWLLKQDSVVASAPAALLQGFVDGRPESLLGVGDGTEGLGGTVLAGRRPVTPTEVALGSHTLAAAGLDIGDTVKVGSPAAEQPFTVVGTVVLPGLHTNDSDAASLGGGALFTIEGLGLATGTSVTAEGTSNIFVDLHGESARAFSRRLVMEVKTPVGDEILVTGPDAPDKDALPDVLDAYRESRATLFALAGVLSGLAMAGLALALVVSVRRRRREFATFAAIGATRRQLFAIVGWHATTVAVIAGLLGVGVGIVAGRVLWLAVARELGIVPVAPVPLAAAAAVVPITLVVLNIAGFFPARQASRIAVAEALRSE